MKGKGGYNHYIGDQDGYFIGKGKGKGKSKSKNGHWLEGQASWMKGKGKREQGAQPHSECLQAYSFDLFVAGLEVSEAMGLSPGNASRSDPQMGMLDSGATASERRRRLLSMGAYLAYLFLDFFWSRCERGLCACGSLRLLGFLGFLVFRFLGFLASRLLITSWLGIYCLLVLNDDAGDTAGRVALAREVGEFAEAQVYIMCWLIFAARFSTGGIRFVESCLWEKRKKVRRQEAKNGRHTSLVLSAKPISPASKCWLEFSLFVGFPLLL